jgi:hypothetical protein
MATSNEQPFKIDCARGQHGPLVDGEPIHLENCVNVERCCSICEQVVCVWSTTTAAWEKRQRRHAVSQR